MCVFHERGTQVKLTVLGGASFVPNPGQGCSSYLIESDSASILLDCGPDTLQELRKHTDYSKLDAIVISHLHADHILDLIPFRYGLVYGLASLDERIKLYLPPDGMNLFNNIADALDVADESNADFWAEPFDILEYATDETVEIEDLVVSFTPTQHFVPCNAIKVQNEAGTICYTADTGRVDNLVQFATNADILISEATSVDHVDVPKNARGHLTPEDAGDLARLSKSKLLLLSHLWSERSDDEVLQAARRRFDGNIAIAKPGSTLYVG